VAFLAWSYLAGLIAIWLAFRFAGDRWWALMPLQYGPRWVWGLPLIMLVPASLLLRRKLLWVDLAAAIIFLFPLMGFCIPWRTAGGRGGGTAIRVLNFNTSGKLTKPDALLRVIDEAKPDIIALQEAPAQNDALTLGLRERGWHIAEKPAGLYFASRFPILSQEYVSTVEKWRHLAAFFVLETPGGKINFVNLHLETPRHGIDSLIDRRHFETGPATANIARRRMESEQISRKAASLPGPVAIAGDFNLVADSTIFRECWSGYSDAFAAAGFGFGNTKFTRRWGVRIDHLLMDGHFRAQSCRVGPDLGSDHRPLISEIELKQR
jgi:endonuclease/exonuclease/phosphatase (EEP) superfamily protein YafD